MVHAGAAANALQRGAQLQVGIGLRAAVVQQQDQVHFLGRRPSPGWRGALMKFT